MNFIGYPGFVWHCSASLQKSTLGALLGQKRLLLQRSSFYKKLPSASINISSRFWGDKAHPDRAVSTQGCSENNS